jgi:Mor family transcriptional regulator
MTDLYDSDEEIKKILNKEDDISSTEMINKITENLYELESILQEKENEEILKSIYKMLNKKSIEPKEEQCSIQ